MKALSEISGVWIATAVLVWGASGCGSGGSDREREAGGCEPQASEDFSVGRFGRRRVEKLEPGAGLPVWQPIQGGMVVGFNLLAEGVPRGAERLTIAVHDREGGERLAGMVRTASHFLCEEAEEVRVLDRVMVPFEAGGPLDPTKVDGRSATLDVGARFPHAGGELIEVGLEMNVVLEDRLPPSRHAERGSP